MSGEALRDERLLRDEWFLGVERDIAILLGRERKRNSTSHDARSTRMENPKRNRYNKPRRDSGSLELLQCPRHVGGAYHRPDNLRVLGVFECLRTCFGGSLPHQATEGETPPNRVRGHPRGSGIRFFRLKVRYYRHEAGSLLQEHGFVFGQVVRSAPIGPVYSQLAGEVHEFVDEYLRQV